MAVAERVQQVPLFAGLSAQSWSLLARDVRSRWFHRGDVIVHKGDPGDAMFLIKSGRVKIILPSDQGDEVILGSLGVGDFFGELSLLDGDVRSATIVATEATQTIVIRRDDLYAAIRVDPAIALELLQVLARRLRKTNQFVEDAVFLDVRARLAKRLLELAEVQGVPEQDGTGTGVRLTQAELATMVGATRESVQKHLRFFRARGALDVKRGRIIILQAEQLRRRIY